MGKSSGGQPQLMMMPSQNTTTNQLPAWVQEAGKANYDAASNMSPAAFAPYQSQRVADMNDVQYNALNAINANAGQASKNYEYASALANQGNQNAANIMGGAISGMYGALNPSSVQNAIAGLNNAAQLGYNQVAANGNPLSGALETISSVYNPAAGGVRDVGGAQGMISSAYNPVYQAANPAMSSLRQSVNDARGLQGFQADRVNAQTLPQGDISQYLNPYTQNVIDSSLATLDQQRQNALNSNADRAINAKSGFGSRQAIQDAATNAQYGLQGAQLAANLNNQNFQQAQQALQADQARNLQAQLANQQAGIQGAGVQQNAAQLTGSLANTLGNLGINAGQFGVQAGNAFGNLGLQNAQTGLDAGQAMGSLGLTSRGQDISAQTANQNAALQNQSNQISAIQNAGGLGLQNANLSANALNNIAGIGQSYGALNNQTAQLMGALTDSQQANWLNSQNAALAAGNQLQNQQQNRIAADQQAYADYQNSLLAPLNLRMQALGMTPYNTSTTSSGFTTQAYQPTSSSPLATALGLGLGGLSTLKGLGGISGIRGLF